MSGSRYFPAIVAAVTALAILLTLGFWALAVPAGAGEIGYDSFFDPSRVHSIDIRMPDWENFLHGAGSEEYAACDLVIDGETLHSVGFRAKGNGSLFAVNMMGSPRMSWKIEFDRFIDRQSYHGLDKLCLNNLVEDSTYMKDLLAYRAMAALGVPAPLCSYVFVTVNGEDFGLYQAVEGVEDGFLRRNFGAERGQLYKPESAALEELGIGGEFRLFRLLGWALDHRALFEGLDLSAYEGMSSADLSGAAFDFEDMYGDGGSFFGGGELTASLLGGSEDLLLRYIDDRPASYPCIFNMAKTRGSYRDRMRLIAALERLGRREDLTRTVDAERVIAYFAAHNFFVNSDSYTGMSAHNYYLYEHDGQLSLIPWDYNLACGTMLMTARYAVNDPIDEPMAVRSDGGHPMFEWITADEAWKARYYERLGELLDAMDFDALIDETAALIRPYVERDPTKFVTLREFDEGLAMMKRYLRLREQSVRGQLAGRIPADKAGQEAHPELLVGTEGLDLHALGDVTMGIADGRQDPSLFDALQGGGGLAGLFTGYGKDDSK